MEESRRNRYGVWLSTSDSQPMEEKEKKSFLCVVKSKKREMPFLAVYKCDDDVFWALYEEDRCVGAITDYLMIPWDVEQISREIPYFYKRG